MQYSEMDEGMYHFVAKMYAYNEFIHRIIFIKFITQPPIVIRAHVNLISQF